jgi:hypothetical protein
MRDITYARMRERKAGKRSMPMLVREKTDRESEREREYEEMM